MQVLDKTKNTVLATEAILADTLFARVKGLLGTKELAKGSGLILKPCNSIHMFFMRYPIDVIFLDAQNKVVGVASNIRPWRLSRVFWKARLAVELPADTVAETRTEVGDEISVE